jgi:hypothetical protein
MRLIRATAAAAVVLALGLAAGANAATGLDLNKVILAPGQVGSAFQLLQRTDEHGLETRTLDLCGITNYPSESLRLTRMQVNYGAIGNDLSLSNEVVTYKAGGAAQAMRELAEHADHCPKTPVAPGVQGLPPLRFTVTRLVDIKLLPGYVAVRVRVTGTVGGKHVDQTSYAVYQRFGNVLSGVYSNGPATGDQQSFCLHAAEQSAINLRKIPSLSETGPTA